MTSAKDKKMKFPWQVELERKVTSCIGNHDSKKLQEVTLYLLINASKEVCLCISARKFKCVKRLYKILSIFITHVHLKRTLILTLLGIGMYKLRSLFPQCKPLLSETLISPATDQLADCREDCQPLIKDQLASILALLLDLQLFLSRSSNTSKSTDHVVQEILLITGTDTKYLWNVLLQSNLVKKKQFRNIASPLLERLFGASPWKVLQDPENYLKCLLSLRLWHKICLPDQRSKVQRMALGVPVSWKLSKWLKAHAIPGLPLLVKKEHPLNFIKTFLKKVKQAVADQLVDILIENVAKDDGNVEPEQSTSVLMTVPSIGETTDQIFFLDKSGSKNSPICSSLETTGSDNLIQKIQSNLKEISEIPPKKSRKSKHKSKPDCGEWLSKGDQKDIDIKIQSADSDVVVKMPTIIPKSSEKSRCNLNPADSDDVEETPYKKHKSPGKSRDKQNLDGSTLLSGDNEYLSCLEQPAIGSESRNRKRKIKGTLSSVVTTIPEELLYSPSSRVKKTLASPLTFKQKPAKKFESPQEQSANTDCSMSAFKEKTKAFEAKMLIKIEDIETGSSWSEDFAEVSLSQNSKKTSKFSEKGNPSASDCDNNNSSPSKEIHKNINSPDKCIVNVEDPASSEEQHCDLESTDYNNASTAKEKKIIIYDSADSEDNSSSKSKKKLKVMSDEVSTIKEFNNSSGSRRDKVTKMKSETEHQIIPLKDEGKINKCTPTKTSCNSDNESESVQFLNEPTQKYVPTCIPFSKQDNTSSEDSDLEVTEVAIDASCQTHLTSDEDISNKIPATFGQRNVWPIIKEKLNKFENENKNYEEVQGIVESSNEAISHLTSEVTIDTSCQVPLTSDRDISSGIPITFGQKKVQQIVNEEWNKYGKKYEIQGIAENFDDVSQELSTKPKLIKKETQVVDSNSSDIFFSPETSPDSSRDNSFEVKFPRVYNYEKTRGEEYKTTKICSELHSPKGTSDKMPTTFFETKFLNISTKKDVSDNVKHDNKLSLSLRKRSYHKNTEILNDHCEIIAAEINISPKKTSKNLVQENIVSATQFLESDLTAIKEKKSPTPFKTSLSTAKISLGNPHQRLSRNKLNCPTVDVVTNILNDPIDSDALILDSDSTGKDDDITPTRLSSYKTSVCAGKNTSRILSRKKSNSNSVNKLKEVVETGFLGLESGLTVIDDDNSVWKNSRLNSQEPNSMLLKEKGNFVNVPDKYIGLNLRKDSSDKLSPNKLSQEVTRNSESHRLDLENSFSVNLLSQTSQKRSPAKVTESPSKISNLQKRLCKVSLSKTELLEENNEICPSLRISTVRTRAEASKSGNKSNKSSPKTENPKLLDSTTAGQTKNSEPSCIEKLLIEIPYASKDDSEISSTETVLNSALQDLDRKNSNFLGSATEIISQKYKSKSRNVYSSSDSEVSEILKRRPQVSARKKLNLTDDEDETNNSNLNKKPTVFSNFRTLTESFESECSSTREFSNLPNINPKITALNKKTNESPHLDMYSQSLKEKLLITSNRKADMERKHLSNCLDVTVSLSPLSLQLAEKSPDCSLNILTPESRSGSSMDNELSNNSSQKQTSTSDVSVQTVLHSKHIAMLSPPIRSKRKLRKRTPRVPEKRDIMEPTKTKSEVSPPSVLKENSLSSPGKGTITSDQAQEAMATRISPYRRSIAYYFRPRMKTPKN